MSVDFVWLRKRPTIPVVFQVRRSKQRVGRLSLDEGVRRILGEGYLFLECIWLHRSKARRLLILLVFRRTFQIPTSFDFVSPEPSRTRREGTEEISTKFKEPYHSQHAVLKLS